MCGRFVASAPVSELAEHFVVDEIVVDEAPPPRFNVAPTLDVLAVAESRRSGQRRLGTFKWGLVPSWAKDPSIGNRMINARAESAADKPAFRTALARRRCLIPADGFYEWQRVEKGPKRPHLIRHRDGSPLALAGLWEVWRPPGAGDDDPWLRTCTIVTTSANDAIAPLHDRMPVLVAPGDWDRWLDPSVDDPAAIADLLVPAPADVVEIIPVSTAVNDVRNDGPDLVEPVG
jgi:putative SOS response-associated peptidase YedK